jgi:hypothetical protein
MFLLPCDECKSQTFLWDFETTTGHYMLRGSPTVLKKIIGKSMIFISDYKFRSIRPE